MSTRECLTTALGFEVYASRLEQSARKNHVITINKTGQHDYLYDVFDFTSKMQTKGQECW
jgi:hypothetical protein